MKTLLLLISLTLPSLVFARGEYDKLECQSASAVQLETISNVNVVAKTTFSNKFTILQNGNRNYATVYANNQEIGIVSYQRSQKGVQISIGRWTANINSRLVAIKDINVIPTGPSSLAYSQYRLTTEKINAICNFSRVLLN